MKLVILSLLLTFASADLVLQKCCPCSEDNPVDEVTEFNVDEPDVSQGKPQDLIKDLVLLLVKKQLIDQPTATSFLITFRIPVPFNLPREGKPLTKDIVLSWPVRGKPDAHKKFVEQLIPLIQNPSIPRVIKILIEFLLNNNVPPSQVITTTIRYNIITNIKYVVVPDKIPQIKPVRPEPTFPDDGVHPGEPGESTVTITAPIDDDDIPSAVNFLLNVLFKNNIIPVPTANDILNTFRIPGRGPFNPDDGKPLTPTTITTIVIKNVKDKPRKTFITNLTPLLNNPDPTKLVQVLLTFVIDTGIFDLPTAQQFFVVFRIPGKLTFKPSPPEPVFPVDHINPGQPGESTVTITTPIDEDNIAPIVNIILQILVKKDIIRIPSGNDILTTFHIPGKEPFNPEDGNPLTPNTVNTIVIQNVKDKPRKTFITNLTPLLANPTNPTKLVQVLITFLIDSGIFDLPTAQQFLVIFRIPGKLTFKPSPPEPVFPVDQINPGEPGESTVTITTPINDDDIPFAVNTLLQILFKKNVIPIPTGNDILTTFRIPGKEPFNPDNGKPLTPNTVNTIVIQNVKDKPRKTFITNLTPLLANPNNPTKLVQVLITFLIDSGIFDLPTAHQFLVIFRITGKLTFKPSLPEPVFPVDQINPGEPGESTVTITTPIEEDNIPPTVNTIFEILFKKNVFPIQTINDILATFRIPGKEPFNPDDGKPLTPGTVTTIVIKNVKDKPRKTFITNLTPLVANPNNPTKLVQVLITFLVDSGIFDLPTAQRFLVIFRIPGKLQFKPSLPEPVFPIDQLNPGQPGESTVTITSISEDDAPPAIYTLFDILVKKNIFPVQTVNDILAHFRLPGREPYNPDDGRPLTPGNINTIDINNVDDKPRQQFITNLTPLLANPNPSKLVQVLLTFVIDSGVFDLPTAQRFLVIFRITGRLQFKPAPPKRPEPTFPIDQITPGEPGESTVTITVVEESDVPAAVNALLDILVTKNYFPIPTAETILATFRIPGKGRFNPANAKPLTPATVGTITIQNVDDKPRKRFITELTTLLTQGNPKPLGLIQILITFLLDTGTFNLPTAQRFFITFRITGKLQFKAIPPVVEPPIVPGQDPGPNAQIDSTVKITNVVRDLPPLIKRLVELCVKANLLPQPASASILVTFNIQPDGVPLTPLTIVKLVIGGKPGAAKKFITNLTPLIVNPTSIATQQTLVKILTELLIDNAVIHHNSAAQFLVAYGVGVSISVRVTQVQVPDKGLIGNLLDVAGNLLQPGKQRTAIGSSEEKCDK